jgi:hypothetical protein
VSNRSGKKEETYFLYALRKIRQNDLDNLEETAKIWQQGYELLKKHGIQMHVVFMPIKYRAYHQACQIFPNSELNDWSDNKLPELVKEKLSDISPDIQYTDLSQTFRDAVNGGEMIYFPDDSHWNGKGHALAAEFLSQKI